MTPTTNSSNYNSFYRAQVGYFIGFLWYMEWSRKLETLIESSKRQTRSAFFVITSNVLPCDSTLPSRFWSRANNMDKIWIFLFPCVMHKRKEVVDSTNILCLIILMKALVIESKFIVYILKLIFNVKLEKILDCDIILYILCSTICNRNMTTEDA